jgi:uncharacterized protein YecE (DUF72 family)
MNEVEPKPTKDEAHTSQRIQHFRRQGGHKPFHRLGNAPAVLNPPGVARIRVGPAGWSYADWNGIAYPKRRPPEFHEAAYLARYFDTIEINTSFYQPLRPENCKQWLEQVSTNPRFLFTAKLWQKFTHELSSDPEDERAVRSGFAPLREAGKLGAVLLQFPFSFHLTKENFDYLKKLLEKFADYPLVVEVRHATWNDPRFHELLAERRISLCNIDQPIIGRSLKPSERATGPIGYVRLHGRRYDTWFTDKTEKPSPERYNYLYSNEELEPWLKRIRRLEEDASTIFVILNNHPEAKALVNAFQILHKLTREKQEIPEPLLARYPELEGISIQPLREPSLFPPPQKGK